MSSWRDEDDLRKCQLVEGRLLWKQVVAIILVAVVIYVRWRWLG